jgi:hypothetical protein
MWIAYQLPRAQGSAYSGVPIRATILAASQLSRATVGVPFAIVAGK